MKQLLLFTSFLFFQVTFVQNAAHLVPAAGNGIAVVELFTSEGCSSCPEAEQVLAKLAKAYPQNLFLLEFHVDYWNRLGWTDPFSNAAYSDRQRTYNRAPGADGVYTPQAIVNGNQHLVGSNENGIRKILDASLAGSGSRVIKISGTMLTGQQVTAKYICDVQEASALNIALVQRYAQTVVKGGENSGRTLPHIQVVRDFVTVPARPGTVQLHLPDRADAKDFELIAYLQNKKTYAVTDAVAGNIQNLK